MKFWNQSETVETLNDFFSNIVQNLNISRYSEHYSVAENINRTNSQSYSETQKYPSILHIQSQCEAKIF